MTRIILAAIALATASPALAQVTYFDPYTGQTVPLSTPAPLPYFYLPPAPPPAAYPFPTYDRPAPTYVLPNANPLGAPPPIDYGLNRRPR